MIELKKTTVSGTVSDNLATLAGVALAANAGIATNGTLRVVLATDQPQLTNALKVDGSGFTQPVSGTFWPATQPVSGAFFQATQPVSGTFWQATQPVSGTFWQATQPISNANLDTTISSRLKPADTLAGVTTVAAVTAITNALPAGTNVIGHVIVDTAPTTAVTGTFYQSTQPVSIAGSVTVAQATASNLKVDLSGTGANSTALKVDGSAVTQPVSGTLTGITNPVAVTGTFYQATQPVSGTFYQATQPVSATALPLPSNAAQETGGNLATLAGAARTTDGRTAFNIESFSLLRAMEQQLAEMYEASFRNMNWAASEEQRGFEFR